MTFGIPDPGRASKAVELVVAGAFRRVCQFTGDIAPTPTTSGACVLTDDPAPQERPAPCVPRTVRAVSIST